MSLVDLQHSEGNEKMLKTTSFHKFKDRAVRNYQKKENDGKPAEWLLQVKATLGILIDRPWDVSIYKVPSQVRKRKEDAYNPRIVSIGPFHHHKPELEDMEEHKWRYMLNFFRRYKSEEQENGDRPASIVASDLCGEAVSKLVEEARVCYFEEINLDKDELAEVLLVDGCFILELFIRHAAEEEEEKKEEMMRLSSIEQRTGISNRQSDPILSNLFMVPTLQHDLALVENQIPLAILHKLFTIIKKSNKHQIPFSLNKYVLLFFRSAMKLSDHAVDSMSNSSSTHKHVLDILHHTYKPTISKIPLEGDKRVPGFSRSAIDLVWSGIQLRAGDENSPGSLLDITFIDGIITIPPLRLHWNTECIFRNLIAYENSNSGITHHISSYVRLMNSLVRSLQDAKLLIENGIIITKSVGHNEDIMTLFYDLRREVVSKDFCFDGLCEQVNAYNKSWLNLGRIKAAGKVRWRKYMVALEDEYFNSPWTFISFIAAIVLLILTVMSTYYAARTYYYTYKL